MVYNGAVKPFLLVAVFSALPFTPAPASARGCTGAADCTACKNCNGCQHCAKEGGHCGACARPTTTRTVAGAQPTTNSVAKPVLRARPPRPKAHSHSRKQSGPYEILPGYQNGIGGGSGGGPAYRPMANPVPARARRSSIGRPNARHCSAL